MVNTMGLRGLIYGKYKSQTAFATHIGWSKQKLSKIINGAQEPTVRDIGDMAAALDKPLGEIAEIFLPN